MKKSIFGAVLSVCGFYGLMNLWVVYANDTYGNFSSFMQSFKLSSFFYVFAIMFGIGFVILLIEALYEKR